MKEKGRIIGGRTSTVRILVGGSNLNLECIKMMIFGLPGRYSSKS